MREAAEAVRTAVRESAEADEPLHSSTVTHPAAASPSGCDASIPPVRCRRRDGWIGRDRGDTASWKFTLRQFSGQRNTTPHPRRPIRSRSRPRFERRPRRALLSDRVDLGVWLDLDARREQARQQDGGLDRVA